MILRPALSLRRSLAPSLWPVVAGSYIAVPVAVEDQLPSGLEITLLVPSRLLETESDGKIRTMHIEIVGKGTVA